MSTLIWMNNWPKEGFKEVGKLYLQIPGKSQIQQKEQIINMAVKMHYDMQEGIKDYESLTDHKILLTPCSYLNLIQTIK